MMSRFDDIQKTTFGHIHDTFGDVASWIPSDGSEVQTANVLVQSNDIQFAVTDKVYYEDAQCRIEYYDGSFVGLYEAVKGAESETVTVNGKDYLVLGDEKKWDGKTYVLYCQEK